jgi:hypothetical protein
MSGIGFNKHVGRLGAYIQADWPDGAQFAWLHSGGHPLNSYVRGLVCSTYFNSRTPLTNTGKNMQQLIKAEQTKKAEAAYNLIARSANENATMQGAGGIFGTITSVAADVVSIGMYSAMWNNIRKIYGHNEFEANQVKNIIPKLGKEIISDIVFDKIIGYIPLIGIATNIMCAKSMSWRLGILFAMLSSRGSDMPEDSIIKSVRLIRE